MSIVLDYQYVNLLSTQLEGFTWIRSRLALCRCPMCGDSAKKKSKRRFYIYQNTKQLNSDRFSVYCQNCFYSASFGRFLEEYNTGLYSQYRIELFKELGYTSAQREVIPDVDHTESIKRMLEKLAASRDILAGCVKLSELPDDHPCKAYVIGRKIPEQHHSILWYTDNFRKTVEDFDTEIDPETTPDDARLVIPFFDENKKLICIQGRALSEYSSMRYITVKLDDMVQKVYGLERLDKTKTISVVEGPLDSLFIPNCIATADANLMSAGIGDLFIPDNQYRNRAVCNIIDKIILSGKKVVLFPENVKSKDLNDMIENGMSQSELLNLVASNVYHGLRAKIAFARLRKVQ